MDVKEKVIGSIIVRLANEDLTMENVINTVSICLNDYDLVQHKDLPSVDVIDNLKIVKHYFATKKMEGLSDKTIRTYSYHINSFINTMNIDLRNVDTNTVRFYLATLGEHASNSFVDDARRILNTFFNFCEDEEYIKKNPVKRINKIKRNKVMETPFTDIEVEKIRDSCITKRELAIVDFLFSTGCRREEITKIKLNDIDFVERSVLIHGKGGKDRVVFMSARCEKHIVEYIENRGYTSEYLFCQDRFPHDKLSVDGLAIIVKNIGFRANVTNVHLHRFRKWFGTHMADYVPLQDLKEMMGHSKIETTNNYYVYIDKERIKNSYRKNAA